MLILTRRSGESLRISDNIVVTVLEIRGNQVRVGIDAPKEMAVLREELLEPAPTSAAADRSVPYGTRVQARATP